MSRTQPAPSTACVILNYGNWPEVDDTIRSCLAAGIEPGKIFFVDNASPVDETTNVRLRRPDIEVVRLDSNGGYGRGMNLAVSRVLSEADGVDRVLLLTHEVEFDDDLVGRLSRRLDADPTVAAVGPVLHHRNRPNELFSAGGSFLGTSARPTHLRDPDASADVRWLDGSCVMYRIEALVDVDGFDERYFMYFEDVDLHCRLRRRGWTVAVEPAAHASQRPQAAVVSGSWIANRLIFAARNMGRRATCREAWSISRIAVGRSRHGDPTHLRALVGSVPWILRRTALYRSPPRRLDPTRRLEP
jgi:GT2 family glycosyltransferase